MQQRLREDIFTQARKWVYEAGDMIKEKMNGPLTIDIKSDERDLVTELDMEIEQFFARKIRKTYPDHYLVSEEGFGDDLVDEMGIVWFIDPIDGTMNFIHQKRNFAISVGIYHERIGEIGLIYDVSANTLYSSKRGQGAFRNDDRLTRLPVKTLAESVLSFNHHWLMENKRYDRQVIEGLLGEIRAARTFGSAALEFAYVAEGALDAYFKGNLESWDIAAGMILVNEVGGKTTNMFGDPVDVFEVGSVLTSNHSIHRELTEDYLQKSKK